MRLSKAARAILHKLADELLKHPDHWTQGYYARNKNGSHVSEASPDAVYWCLEGLLTREEHGKRFGSPGFAAVQRARDAITRKIGYSTVEWNDRPGRKVGGVQRMLRAVANG